MSGDASWELQSAIYNLLQADPGIISLLGNPARIYDAVPENIVFPYLTIGEIRSKDWPGVEGGQHHQIRLNVWSRYGGRKELKEIYTAVYAVLHDATISLPNYNIINIRYVFGDMWQRPENNTFNGVVRYRAVTQPK
ncbi:MAG: DUF3168 domain-containing protein [bacterium]